MRYNKYIVKVLTEEMLADHDPCRRQKLRNDFLKASKEISLDQAIEIIKPIFEDIYLFELYIYKARHTRTTVEIEILKKSSFDEGFANKVKDNAPRCIVKLCGCLM